MIKAVIVNFKLQEPTKTFPGVQYNSDFTQVIKSSYYSLTVKKKARKPKKEGI